MPVRSEASRIPDNPTIAAQRRDPANRVAAPDVAGTLAGRDFRGKVLIDLNLKGANLRGADFTGAIICGSDLTDADLTGARLDRALIGGSTRLHGANLTNASARALDIADASGMLRADGADLRDARITCDLLESSLCQGDGIGFASMAGADLRGATVDRLCCEAKGLEAARLDGAVTPLNGYGEVDFTRLAAGVGEAGQLTFVAIYGFSGRRTSFTGKELRDLATIVPRMHAASARASFDCARAATRVEKVICVEPKLAALDRALAWLWQRTKRTAEQKSAQRAWLVRRAQCPPRDLDSPDAFSAQDFGVPADPRGCIGIAYAERIRELAPQATAPLENGTYTTDAPLVLPRGPSAALAEKFILARGYRVDQITMATPVNGAGLLAGTSLGGNGHICSFAASAAETTRTGARFRVTDDPATPDEVSISFVVTPQIVLRVGGQRQFQCGARAGWSEVYFRQPDGLVAKVKAEWWER